MKPKCESILMQFKDEVNTSNHGNWIGLRDRILERIKTSKVCADSQVKMIRDFTQVKSHPNFVRLFYNEIMAQEGMRVSLY